MKNLSEDLLPPQLRGLSVARARRGLWNRPRRVLVWWRHRHAKGAKVLANSIPKAGTYLLKRCLDLSEHFESLDLGVAVYGLQGRKGLSAWRPTLRRLGGGIYVQAHLPFTPQAERIVNELGYKHVLIVRDPRDIAVSRYQFETAHKHLPFHDLFAKLPDDATRLRISICGDEGSAFGDIGARMRAYLEWRGKACCVLRYENLVGPRGGGSRADQVAELDCLYRHLDLTLPRERLEAIADNLYAPTARTFRKGRIGDWRNHFAPAHKELFKQLAGDILVDLGYETDSDW